MRRPIVVSIIASRWLLAAGVMSVCVNLAHADVTYEGTATIRVVFDSLGLLPFAANVGDEFRFRVTVDPSTPSSPDSADALGGTTYENAIKTLSIAVSDETIPLPPTTFDPDSVNLLDIRNDVFVSSFIPKQDHLGLLWRQPDPSRDQEYQFQFSLEDNEAGVMLSSQSIPTSIDYALSTGWSIGFNVYNAQGERDSLDLQVTGFSVVPAVEMPGLTSSQFTGRRIPNEAFQAVSIDAQLPNALGWPSDRKVSASLWVSYFNEVATLQFFDQNLAGIRSFSLRCGPAGTEGASIWESAAGPPLPNQSFRILSADLAPTGRSGPCAEAINNIASLKAAARDRLLYIQLEGNGWSLRGQLWPQSLGLRKIGLTSEAGPSDQQVVGNEGRPLWARARAALTFTEHTDTLAYVGYTVPERHRFLSVGLHCARAGQDGDLVAQLPLAKGLLSTYDLLPTYADGPCGVNVNNVASLLEALLRGNIYAVFVLAEPQGLELRGQFQRP